MAFFKAKPERVQRISSLNQSQQPLYEQMQAALQGQGAGGAFGESADYYRSLLSGEGAADFEAPLQRQFREQTIPDIAEQFAGLGSGALSSGGFANQTRRAATDLAERLGSIRANLRQQGAQGLAQMGQFGLQPFDELLVRPREPGVLEQLATQFASGAGQGVGLGAGAMARNLFPLKGAA